MQTEHQFRVDFAGELATDAGFISDHPRPRQLFKICGGSKEAAGYLICSGGSHDAKLKAQTFADKSQGHRAKQGPY